MGSSLLDGVDCNGRLPKRPPANRLTRPVADGTADGRKWDPFPYHRIGLRKLPKGRIANVAGDVDSRRAAEGARGWLAVVYR